jgi:hypothetical protein
MRALILAKTEGTYGADATPAKATDAILTTMPTFEVVGKTIARKMVMPHFGEIGRVNIGEGLKIAFQCEVAGSGTNTTPPRISALLKSCGFTETIDADSVDYAPNSTIDTVGCTIYFYVDGRLHKMLGCVGESLKINAKANEYATMDFSMVGLYAGAHATDVALPSDPTYLQGSPPVVKSAGVAIGAYSPLASALDIELANTVGRSISVNAANPVTRYRITNRTVKGSLDPEAVALSAFNPWSLWEAGTASAIAMTIGSAAGNRLVIGIPVAQPSDSPKYGERETIGTYTYAFGANVTLAAGNNELTLSFN